MAGLAGLPGWFSFTTDNHLDVGGVLLVTSLVCDTNTPVDNVWSVFALCCQLFSVCPCFLHLDPPVLADVAEVAD